MNYDVVIVGAGVSGLMTAIELRQSGLDICILEKGQIGQESSWAGGGILSPLYPWRYPDAVNRLAQWSSAHYPDYLRQLHNDTGIDPEYIKSGHLILDTDLDSSDSRRWMETFGVVTEQVEADALQQIEPELADRFTAGLYASNIGQVRNPRLVKALTKKARQLQINIQENTALSAINHSQGEITSIETPTSTLNVGKLLITAGAWSGQLNFSGAQLPDVEPVKGQMIQLQTTPGTLRSVTLYKDHYIVPRKDGKVLAGSTIEYTQFDKTTDNQTANELRRKTIELFPSLKSAQMINHWAGLRPGNKRHTPYVTQHPEIEGLYFNTGHYRNGIILGLASAKLAGDIILQREPILPTHDYGF